MPYVLVAAFSLIAGWAASTQFQEIVPYDVAPGVMLDTGADRGNPRGQVFHRAFLIYF